MEDGRLTGCHLMEVELYTEWDDNHVCIINQWKGGEENPTWWVLTTIAEKLLWDLKDHRQYGPTYFDKSLTLEIKNQMHF